MVTVAIQAGGGSRRMGRDKGLVLLGGKPLVRHVLDRVSGLGEEVLVTTNRVEEYAFLGVRLVPDEVPGGGALAGLHTALAAARGEAVLVVGCDMPFVSRPLLGYLLAQASRAQVVVPRRRGELEPLHAVYARSCLPAVEAALAAGERRMVAFYPQVSVMTVEEDIVARFDPEGLSFFNVNTPQDLVQAERLLAEMGG